MESIPGRQPRGQGNGGELLKEDTEWNDPTVRKRASLLQKDATRLIALCNGFENLRSSGRNLIPYALNMRGTARCDTLKDFKGAAEDFKAATDYKD